MVTWKDIRKTIFGWYKDMFYVIFPNLCIACDTQSKTKNSSFCVDCLYKMPYTDHFTQKNNKVVQHFWGRIPLDHGGALLTLRDESMVSHMMHKLKYKSTPEIGHILGQIAGDRWGHQTLFKKPDIIIPVPLTIKKKAKRGYNQSEKFGSGLSEKIGVYCSDNIILKIKETPSQTGKSRTDRVSNVKDSFEIKSPEKIRGKHVLVVDDVVTTGATLEACCLALLQAGASKISILTIAAAE